MAALAQTTFPQQPTGAAVNHARIEARLTATPQARTGASHFAALGPAGQQIDGA
ncbi:hypothetical protein [Streptomyces sp. NPDC000410]|uniref:hypothetical protein n=1 Tax=Streptomyces sp. NPDC000410 TaxID=3154254 RepID=UPI003332A166